MVAPEAAHFGRGCEQREESVADAAPRLQDAHAPTAGGRRGLEQGWVLILQVAPVVVIEQILLVVLVPTGRRHLPACVRHLRRAQALRVDDCLGCCHVLRAHLDVVPCVVLQYVCRAVKPTATLAHGRRRCRFHILPSLYRSVFAIRFAVALTACHLEKFVPQMDQASGER